MKPLSIEEIKQLKENEWLYIVSDIYKTTYWNVFFINTDFIIMYTPYDSKQFKFEEYGKTWLAYKNKEQAECKGVLKSLICDIGDKVYIVNKDNTYRPIDEGIVDNIIIYDQNIIYEWTSYDYACETIELWDEGDFTADDLGKSVFLDYEQAGQKLKELRGEYGKG